MRTAPLTMALLLVSSAATAPLPYGPLVLEAPKASNGTSFKLERRGAGLDTVLTNAKDVVRSTWAKSPWNRSGLDSNPSLSSQDSLALSRLDDPPHTAQHTDAAAPKLSLADKLKQMINKPIDGARTKLEDAADNVKRHKLAYTIWGLVVTIPSAVGVSCIFLHRTAVKKHKEKNAKMRECDAAIDRGESVPSGILKSRDISSDEDSVLVARSPGTSSSRSSKSSKSGGIKLSNPLANTCQKVKYKPRHPVCRL